MSNTEEDTQIRKEWRTNSHVQIYSNSKRKWFEGEVAQIFHDAEGEWLEIRYDKSMSKQVQRFSTDIKPTDEQIKEMRQRLAKQKAEKEAAPFPEKEMEIRANWTKGHKVQIFSNTHQEWYTGEIMDLLKDEEGEWLNVVWHRENGEAMSKQVQRFSTDVRPIQNEPKKEKEEPIKINTQTFEDEIKQRRQGYKRRAPPFARTCTGVLWQYPATQAFRRTKKLENVEETEEEEETESGIEKWTTEQVCEWVKRMGSAYEKYVPKFRTIRGIKLKHLDEEDFCSIGLPKLHAVKLSFEIQKLLDKSIVDKIKKVDILSWSSTEVAKWAQKQPLLNQYASKFEPHGIDGVILFELSGEDLITIGIRPIHRDKILEIIRDFSKQTFPNCKTMEESFNIKKGYSDATTATATATAAGGAITNQNRNDNNAITKSTSPSGNNKDKMKENGMIHDEKDIEGGDENGYNNNNDKLNLKKNNEMSRHKRRQSVQMVTETPLYIQVLKDMADLLNTISSELTNEKVQRQAKLVQEKVELLLSQIKDPMVNITTEENIPTNNVNNGKKKSTDNAQASGRSSPFAEVEGKPVAGIQLSYVNTLEQKKGHRRRQSMPYLTQNSQDNEEDEELSDIE